jgi:hypothetical protein
MDVSSLELFPGRFSFSPQFRLMLQSIVAGIVSAGAIFFDRLLAATLS